MARLRGGSGGAPTGLLRWERAVGIICWREGTYDDTRQRVICNGLTRPARRSHGVAAVNARHVPDVDREMPNDYGPSGVISVFYVPHSRPPYPHCGGCTAFFHSRLGGSNSRRKLHRSLRQLRPTKCGCPVSGPDRARRGLLLILAAATYESSRCSSVNGCFSLHVFGEAPKAARARRCAGVRGSVG
jgi:hypothetical protein